MPDELEKLLGEFMLEVKGLREENARILERLEDEASVAKRLAVQLGDRMRLLKVSEISFITTNERGLSIHATDGQIYVNFKSITEVDKLFAGDQRIMKTHKSYLVNLNQVESLKPTSGGRDLAFYGWPSDVTAKVAYTYVDELERRLGHA